MFLSIQLIISLGEQMHGIEAFASNAPPGFSPGPIFHPTKQLSLK